MPFVKSFLRDMASVFFCILGIVFMSSVLAFSVTGVPITDKETVTDKEVASVEDCTDAVDNDGDGDIGHGGIDEDGDEEMDYISGCVTKKSLFTLLKKRTFVEYGEPGVITCPKKTKLKCQKISTGKFLKCPSGGDYYSPDDDCVTDASAGKSSTKEIILKVRYIRGLERGDTDLVVQKINSISRVTTDDGPKLMTVEFDDGTSVQFRCVSGVCDSEESANTFVRSLIATLELTAGDEVLSRDGELTKEFVSLYRDSLEESIDAEIFQKITSTGLLNADIEGLMASLLVDKYLTFEWGMDVGLIAAEAMHEEVMAMAALDYYTYDSVTGVTVHSTAEGAVYSYSDVGEREGSGDRYKSQDGKTKKISDDDNDDDGVWNDNDSDSDNDGVSDNYDSDDDDDGTPDDEDDDDDGDGIPDDEDDIAPWTEGGMFMGEIISSMAEEFTTEEFKDLINEFEEFDLSEGDLQTSVSERLSTTVEARIVTVNAQMASYV